MMRMLPASTVLKIFSEDDALTTCLSIARSAEAEADGSVFAENPTTLCRSSDYRAYNVHPIFPDIL